MKEEAGNEYQGLPLEGLGITVLATQEVAESDISGNQYDADATYDEADRVTTDELKAILTASNHVTLDKDYILTDGLWKPIKFAGNQASYTLDGAGHTISGLTDGLLMSSGRNLTVRNLTIANSNLTAGENNNGLGVGAIVNWSDFAASLVLENCHAVNVTVTGSSEKNACPGCAGLVGYSNAATTAIKNCSAKNVTVNGLAGSAAGIIGMYGDNTGLTVEQCVVEDATLSATNANKVGQIVGSVVNASATLKDNTANGKLVGREHNATVTVE